MFWENGWVYASIQTSEKQAEAGLPSFEANHRHAFLLEPTRYFWVKKQCSFASQTFQIITAAIAIKGCSPALLNFYVYYCKVNVCVVRSALKICVQPIFLADQISCRDPTSCWPDHQAFLMGWEGRDWKLKGRERKRKFSLLSAALFVLSLMNAFTLTSCSAFLIRKLAFAARYSIL